MTTQTELRDALNFMKDQSGTGSKSRKQQKFREVYTPLVGHIVTGERYDDAGIGPATAQSAVESAYPHAEPSEHDTISESLIGTYGGPEQSLSALVADLDKVAELSGNEQKDKLVDVLKLSAEPSLVTLALLDDENIGLGTSQMRGAFFDGTRDERKHHEAFVPTTVEFIRLARHGGLPDEPIVGVPFDPMLAVPESRGEPDNPTSQRKIDGYRVLIHVEDREDYPYVVAFSRQQNDVTESLPELEEIDWPDGDYILDGEVLAETGSYADTSERVGRSADNVDRDIEMEFHMFDVIVNDGECIADQPFHERHSELVSLVANTDDDRLNHVGMKDDIELAKDEAVANEEEGIIVKDMQGPYEFGKRSTYWQKQKFDDCTVDAKISGFEEGTGEKSGTLGAVLIESSDGVYLGKSGSGFSDAQRDRIWNNQGDWLGRTIEVEGRGIGSQGHIRMPIFKRDRSDDGEADTYDRICEVMKDV